MICLSTTWGRSRFESYAAMVLAFRDRFPAFELSLPPWPAASLPRAQDLKTLGVRVESLHQATATETEAAPRGPVPESLAADAASARRAGAPRLCFDASPLPRPGGWDAFRKALAEPSAGEIVRAGMAFRADAAGNALERLARALFEATRRFPELRLCLQTPPDPSCLPAPEELRDLLRELKSGNVAYAHVAGRAAFLEASVGWPAEAWIEGAGEATEAVVLDDLGPDGPGALPGTGRVSYTALRELRPNGALLVLRPPCDSEEMEIDRAASFLAAGGFS
jgi:hypothetical protein